MAAAGGRLRRLTQRRPLSKFLGTCARCRVVSLGGPLEPIPHAREDHPKVEFQYSENAGPLVVPPADEIALPRREDCRAVDTPPAAPKGHGRISPWRAGLSATLA